MNERHAGERAPTMKRRGILAAAGAVVAGIVAKQGSQPVAAAATMQFANTSTTVTNAAVGATVLTNDTASTTFTVSNTASNSQYALVAHCDNASYGFGLYATGTGYGVSATGNQYAGVFGEGTGSSAAGVTGIGRSAFGAGVSGECDSGTGVIGRSLSGVGVQGLIDIGITNPNTIAVYGLNKSTDANGIGVYGASTHGTGIYGLTAASNQYGVLGQTFEVNSTAIAGACTGNGSSAFSGGTTNPNAFAAFFQGTTVVQGNFAVTGAKSAVVALPRTGDHRLMYCVESPEAWFEDFGEGTLAGGQAEVRLDPDFAALVRTDHYHVFLTPHAEATGLHIASRGAGSFVVRERSGGTGGFTFSWRVVAKRADVKQERLGKFVMPTLPLPDLPAFKAPNVQPPAAPPKKP